MATEKHLDSTGRDPLVFYLFDVDGTLTEVRKVGLLNTTKSRITSSFTKSLKICGYEFIPTLKDCRCYSLTVLV